MVDIYDDLEHFDFSEEIDKLRRENTTLLRRIFVLEETNKILSGKYALSEEKAKQLLTNISSLHKTSTLEVQRKDRVIQELRKKVEFLSSKCVTNVKNCNSQQEKYPPDKALVNPRESHLRDIIYSSNSNRPNSQDRYTSDQKLNKHELSKERYQSEKAVVEFKQNEIGPNSQDKTQDCFDADAGKLIKMKNIENKSLLQTPSRCDTSVNNRNTREEKHPPGKALANRRRSRSRDRISSRNSNRPNSRDRYTSNHKLNKHEFSNEKYKYNIENKSLLLTPSRCDTSVNSRNTREEKHPPGKALANRRRSQSRDRISSRNSNRPNSRDRYTSNHKLNTHEFSKERNKYNIENKSLHLTPLRCESSVKSHNTKQEKYPSDKALTNHRESHLRDKNSSSNSNRPNSQDKYTSNKALHIPDFNKERYQPEKVVVKLEQDATEYNSNDETFDYFDTDAGNMLKMENIENESLPLTHSSKEDQPEEVVVKLEQDATGYNINDEPHDYFDTDTGNMLNMEKIKNESLPLTHSRQSFSPRNIDWSMDRDNRLIQNSNNAHSRSSSYESSQKFYRKRSPSPREEERKRSCFHHLKFI